jgi:hypothetical protein
MFVKLLLLVHNRHSKLVQSHKKKMTHDLLDGQFGTVFWKATVSEEGLNTGICVLKTGVCTEKTFILLSLKWKVVKPLCSKINH